MTVKELFTSVTFEEIAVALHRTHQSDKSIREMASYKEAFDEICHTEFKGNGGEVTFDITEPQEMTDDSLPMLANNVEEDYWENTVGKTVIFPENNPFTNAELAGAILWGMTFYGFSKLKRWKPGETPFGKYGEMAQRLWRKLYLPYLRDKKEIAKLKHLANASADHIAFSLETWEKIDHSQKHQNRSKRKRFYRIENRIDNLERMANRDYLLSKLSEMTCGKAETLRPSIMSAKKMKVDIRESRTYGEIARVDYLAELITLYNGQFWEDCEGFDNMIVVATTSPQDIVTDYENQILSQLFRDLAIRLNMSVELIYGTEPSLPNAEMNLRTIVVK